MFAFAIQYVSVLSDLTSLEKKGGVDIVSSLIE